VLAARIKIASQCYSPGSERLQEEKECYRTLLLNEFFCLTYVLNRWQIFDIHAVETDNDKKYQRANIEICRRGKQRPRLPHAAQVGESHDDDESNAQFHSVIR